MITHKDRTFCASSGTCANTNCPRWIDFGQSYDLPLSLAEFKDSEHCAGFIEHPVMVSLKSGMGMKV